MSNRTLVNTFLIEQLKVINGDSSPFSHDYVFNTNIHGNVFRGLKFIDEIHDFPSLYVTSDLEEREYHTANLIKSRVETVIRGYVHGDNVQELTNSLVQDIEHVIYNMKWSTELSIQDITISQIIVDSGLLAPYGLIEIFLSTDFEIFIQ